VFTDIPGRTGGTNEGDHVRRITVLFTALLALGMLAAPAAAHHDHNLNNPSGCVTIRVGHQAHRPGDPGLKFHGSAHVGAAVEHHPSGHEFGPNIGILGKGNSPVWVGGFECPAE
jgi:hypothetical protein